ncbi:ATP-binding cassette domain-containing protein [Chengkuizengella axinellae]|uniref:ABC transporter ATP-binding protein n=1 Tax=Chengkuizengella axinellae TaxID=3064388 RepID=A0ABT9IZ68_9BACL|nr:ABC transporter ATP-binding protein [Chengkuizengella sp. 2205SS18-9]MDP5274608.1 ABC transporter ATP-binding protein [Chengkuizengella sp. 2205SS18-9]
MWLIKEKRVKNILPWVIPLLIITLISGISPPMFLYFFGVMIDHVLTKSDSDIIILNFILFSFIFILDKILIPLRSYFIQGLYFSIVKEAKSLVIKKLYKNKFENMLNNDHSNLLENATNSFNKGARIFTLFFQSLMVLISLCGYFILLWNVTTYGTLIMSISFFLILFKNLNISKKNMKLEFSQANSRLKEKYYRNILEDFNTLKERKVYHYSNFINGLWKTSYNSLATEKLQFLKKAQMTIGVLQIVHLLLVFGTYTFVIFNNTNSIGNIVISFQVINQLIGISNSFSLQIKQLSDQLISSSYISKYINTDFNKSNKDHIKKQDENEKIDNIVLKKISYTYPNKQRCVLQDVNFTIQKGEIVGLIGNNGAGKTTLCNILGGLLEPTKGKIFVNGVGVTSDELLGKINIAYRDFIKYPATLRQNINFDGNMSSLSEEIVHDLKISTKDKILGVGFNNGKELSGGQWQKIAVSRSFSNKRDIIILDEPTAAMDPISEEIIINRINDYSKKGYGIILVAHRINAIMNCDRVYVMDKGRLVQNGRPEELLEEEGYFKNLYGSQVAMLQKVSVK